MIPGFFAAAGRHSPPVPIEQAPFYSGDLMTTPGWEPVTWPGAFYDPVTNRTIVVWQFVGLQGYKSVRVAAYDHASSTWTRPYSVGGFYLPNDDHGHPAIVRDSAGYIHCFYGSHNNNQQWSVTDSPDDLSQWNPMPSISGGDYTYPKPVLVGDDIHLFMRDRLQNLGLVVRSMTPVNGAGSWSAPVNLVNFGNNTRTYTTEAHNIGGMIHFSCMHTQSSDTTRSGVYYFIYDPGTGSLSNFDSSVTVPSGSLPVDLSSANADFRIFDHGARDGDVPSLQFDTDGSAHVLFADGTTPNYDLKHMMLSSGSWTSPVVVGQIEDQQPSVGYVDTYTLVPANNGAMEAWYNVDGDRVRRIRSSGGTWSPESVIAESDSLPFGRGSAVLNAHPSFRVTISEITGDASDSAASLLKLYAHGDSGFVGDAIPNSEDTHWGDTILLVQPGGVGSAIAYDASKSCLPITLSGSASVSADAPFSGGRSIRTGSGGYFTVLQENSVSTDGSHDFCLDVWFKLDESPGSRLMLLAAARATGSTAGFALMVNTDGVLQFLLWGGGQVRLDLIGSDPISAGQWYLASAERAGGETTLYLDGVTQASGVQSGTPGFGGAVDFGRDPLNSGRHLDGWICEPRFTRAVRYGGASFTPVLAPWPR